MKHAFFALAAYGLWGIFPVFWKRFAFAPADFVLAHRVLWSALLLAALLYFARQWGDFWEALRTGGRRLAALFGSAAAIAANWGVFIYAVQTDRVVEAGLGYFINPLINVLLGMLFLRERPAPAQWLAVALATLGVAYYLYDFGRLPWISLVLGFSFGFYGLLRKLSPMPPLPALQFETGLLAVPALAALLVATLADPGPAGLPLIHDWPALSTLKAGQWLLLAATGMVTVAPLWFFLKAAAGLRLATLGLFQYVAPTLHLLLGVGLYGEAFTTTHAVTFALIWSALGLYSASMVRGAARRAGEKRSVQIPID